MGLSCMQQRRMGKIKNLITLKCQLLIIYLYCDGCRSTHGVLWTNPLFHLIKILTIDSFLFRIESYYWRSSNDCVEIALKFSRPFFFSMRIWCCTMNVVYRISFKNPIIFVASSFFDGKNKHSNETVIFSRWLTNC